MDTTPLVLQPNDLILFTGDSITDAGRRDPAYRPLGRGYVHFAANWLLARSPELNLRFVNTGVSGDTTRTLLWRWQRDCLAHKPDVVSILIGVNDVWCRHAGDELLERSVDIEEFESNYAAMLTALSNSHNCRIALMEPFMFCDDPSNDMFRDLRLAIEVVHKLADRFDALLVPLQTEVDRLIRNIPPARWSDDMVHPYTWAHAWIAQNWLKSAIGGY